MRPTNWREQINVHPAADLFPMMPDDELDELPPFQPSAATGLVIC